MALKVKKGTITAPASNGNTVNTDLSAIFSASEPIKAIIFFAVRNTADEEHSAARTSLSFGFASNRSSTVEQRCYSFTGDNNVGTTVVARGGSFTDVVKMLDLPTTTTISTLLLASITTFNDDDFTLTFSTTLSGARIHYLAIGGSDVDAIVGDFASTLTATQDVTLPSGFGHPDAVLMLNSMNSTMDTEAAGEAGMNIAAMALGQTGQGTLYSMTDAGTTSAITQRQDNAIHAGVTVGIIGTLGDLSAESGWPTDGFEITWSDQPNAAQDYCYLALKGLEVKVASSSIPTAAAPQNQTHSLASGTAKGALMFGWPLAAATGNRTTDTELGGLFIGATDGTDDGAIGYVENDANTNEFVTRVSSVAYIYKAMSGNAQTTGGTASPITSSATAALSGTDLTLTWDDTDTVAREYNVIVFGESPAGGINQAIGLITENETPNALTRAKARDLALITENETPNALTSTKTQAIGLVSEQETLFALTPVKTAPLALATETETPFALTVPGPIEQPIGLITENETPAALTPAKSLALAQLVETETPAALTSAKVMAVALATESETLQAIVAAKAAAIALATETEASFALTPARSVAFALLTESETPNALASAKVKAIAQATETETPNALTPVKTRALGLITETETLNALSQPMRLGLLTETETLNALTPVKTVPLGQAAENETPMALMPAKTMAIGQAAETETPIALTPQKIRSVGLVTDQESMFSIQAVKQLGIALLLEVETPGGVSLLTDAAALPIGPYPNPKLAVLSPLEVELDLPRAGPRLRSRTGEHELVVADQRTELDVPPG